VKKHRDGDRAAEAKRPTWIFIVGSLAVLAALLAFPASTWLRWQQTKITGGQTRKILSRELPVGTDKARVKLFLDGRHWAFGTEARLFKP
jgi:hypothetical protein